MWWAISRSDWILEFEPVTVLELLTDDFDAKCQQFKCPKLLQIADALGVSLFVAPVMQREEIRSQLRKNS